MVSQRMWSLLPAVLAQKKTHEQMASPTWDPHFHPGGYLNRVRTRTEKKKNSTCSSRRTQGRNANKSFSSQCWAHSSKDAPPLQQRAAGHLLFSVLQESQSAKRSGSSSSKSQGQQVPCTCTVTAVTSRVSVH